MERENNAEKILKKISYLMEEKGMNFMEAIFYDFEEIPLRPYFCEDSKLEENLEDIPTSSLNDICDLLLKAYKKSGETNTLYQAVFSPLTNPKVREEGLHPFSPHPSELPDEKVQELLHKYYNS